MVTLNEVLKNALLNKTLRHKNQYNREVELKIEDVKLEHHSYDLEPATQANDWWPASSESYTLKIFLSDGSSKAVSFTEKLDII